MIQLRRIAQPADILAAGAAPPPFGPSFPPDVLRQADALEVWGTTFRDAEDYTEFRLFQEESLLATYCISGY